MAKGSGQRMSYLAGLRNRYPGMPDYIDKLNPAECTSAPIRVFRDMAKGNFNMDLDGPCFANPTWLTHCINAAYTKLTMHRIHVMGNTLLTEASNGQVSPDMQVVMTYDQRGFEAYTHIYNGLMTIQQTGDINYLSVIISRIIEYGRYRVI